MAITEEQQQLINNETKRVLESGKVISKEDKKKLDGILADLQVSLDNLEKTSDGTDQEKNAAFEVYKDNITSYGRELSKIVYSLNISANEHKFMKDVIFKKIVYNRQDVFIGNLVKNDIYGNLPDTFMHGKDEDNMLLDIDSATRLSYLIGKYEVTGLNANSDHFASVVTKIAELTRVFEYYKNEGDAVDKRFGEVMQGIDGEEEVNEQSVDGKAELVNETK